MSGSSTTLKTSSSGPLLKGTPSFISYAEMVVRDYKAAISQAIKDIAEEEQESVRQQAMASESGWETLADKIKVGYDEEARMLRYSVDTSGEDSYKAQNLEFGGLHEAPKPLLRMNAANSKDTFNKRVVDKTYSLLMGPSK